MDSRDDKPLHTGKNAIKRKFISTKVKNSGRNNDLLPDLLQLRTQSYSHLFPLIDFNTYQTKAKVSIYNTEELLSSEEILPYFGSPLAPTAVITGHSGLGFTTPISHLVDEVFDQSSRRKSHVGSRDDPREHLLGDNGQNTFLEQLHIRNSRYAKRDSVSSLMLRRRSLPLIVMESTNAVNFPENHPMTFSSHNVWVGCIFEYMVITRRLTIRLVHTCELFETFFGGKLYAKVSLLPGQVQKKKVSVKAIDKKSHKRIIFEKFSGPELDRMEIGVRLMLGKGLFKKAQILAEWTIPLEKVSLIGENTAWQLFEW